MAATDHGSHGGGGGGHVVPTGPWTTGATPPSSAPVLAEPGTTVPVVRFSEMVQDWLRFTPPCSRARSGRAGVGHGRLLLRRLAVPRPAAVAELRARQPGMMLLIAMAITVAFGAVPPLWPVRPRVLVGAGPLIVSCCWATGWRCGPWPASAAGPWPSCCPTRPSGSLRRATASAGRDLVGRRGPVRPGGASRPRCGRRRARPRWTSR